MLLKKLIGLLVCVVVLGLMNVQAAKIVRREELRALADEGDQIAVSGTIVAIGLGIKGIKYISKGIQAYKLKNKKADVKALVDVFNKELAQYEEDLKVLLNEYPQVCKKSDSAALKKLAQKTGHSTDFTKSLAGDVCGEVVGSLVKDGLLPVIGSLFDVAAIANDAQGYTKNMEKYSNEQKDIAFQQRKMKELMKDMVSKFDKAATKEKKKLSPAVKKIVNKYVGGG